MSCRALQHCTRAMLGIALACLLCVAFGCDQHGQRDAAPEGGSGASRWQGERHAAHIAVPSDEEDAEWNDAIAQARSSADEARQRWLIASEEDRARWAIKWAAPTAAGEVEHVWVRPLHWSPFRIEGVLASHPVAELDCGKSHGEFVSFPIEELSDWVMFPMKNGEIDMSRAQEGGFTLRLLHARYGRPH